MLRHKRVCVCVRAEVSLCEAAGGPAVTHMARWSDSQGSAEEEEVLDGEGRRRRRRMEI